MKPHVWYAVVCTLFTGNLLAQESRKTTDSQPVPAHTATPVTATNSKTHTDVEELRSDAQRLKLLLNQMRANLAFVQTSQTPLKHQFELEADAWQVIIEQMDRRLRALEETNRSESGR